MATPTQKDIDTLAAITRHMAPEDASAVAAMLALFSLYQMTHPTTTASQLAEFAVEVGTKVMELVEERSEEELELAKERNKIRDEAQRRVDEAKEIAKAKEKLRAAGIEIPEEASA